MIDQVTSRPPRDYGQILTNIEESKYSILNGESNDFPFASRFAKNLLDSNYDNYDYEQNEIGFEPKAPRKNSKRIKFQDDKMRKKLDFFKRLNYIEN